MIQEYPQTNFGQAVSFKKSVTSKKKATILESYK